MSTANDIKREMDELGKKRAHLIAERDDLDRELGALDDAEEELRMEWLAAKKRKGRGAKAKR